MYKVMIVDSELLVRAGMATIIDWKKLKFEIVADACEGQQAFELFQIYQPDIVITEIEIPNMNGLQLTELIKAVKPRTKILIVTNSKEFSYAVKAWRLGISGYLLKSEIESDFIGIITAMRNELESEKKKIEIYKMLEQEIALNYKYFKEKLLGDLLNGKDINRGECIARFKRIGYDLENQEFLLLVISKEKMEEKACGKELLFFTMKNIVFEILSDRGYRFLHIEQDDTMILLINKRHVVEKEVEMMSVTMRNGIRECVRINPYFIISRKYDDILLSAARYLECLDSKSIFFFKNSGLHLCSNNFEFSNMTDLHLITCKNAYKKQLIDSLDCKEFDKTKDIVVHLEKYIESLYIFPMKIKMIYTCLIIDLLEYYHHYFKNDFNIYAKYCDLINNADHLKNITEYMQMFIANMIETIKKISKNSLVHEAICYIDKHYNEGISLKAVAEYLNVSKYYLCYLFKKETSENISYYINKVRIENAQKLFRKKQYRSKDIYDMVGFSDQQYFCKIFKKVSGMTVTEYVKKCN